MNQPVRITVSIPGTLPGLVSSATASCIMKMLLLLTTVFLLPACGNLPVGHGHVELDENTDPRFTKPGTPNAIATLHPRGRNVYLNGGRATGTPRMMNNDTVHTGPDSWAKINFMGTFSDKCEQGIGIQEFRTGRLLGETRTCRHHLETGNGSIEADNNHTEYHIRTHPKFTELTVITGTALVSPASNPAARVRVRSRQEVRLQGQTLVGPRTVSEREIRARIKWARTDVPDVISLSLKDAKQRLKNAGLATGSVIEVANSDKKRTGNVQKQDPVKGTSVSYDSTVNLWIWGEPPKLTRVPNVIGLSLKDAKQRLKNAGLVKGSVSKVTNNGKNRTGYVQKQVPGQGASVPQGSSVNLWVWDKPPEQQQPIVR
ncbi:MAG: PASTA domain-containing protein [Pseudomonadota bacterium]